MEKTLTFGGNKREPDIRLLLDMAKVIYDKKWLASADNFELYYMYRDMSLSKKDKDTIAEHHLRYDVTIIPPARLGCEYIKTAGHYHPLVPGTSVTYPEIYEVLEGNATYLIQKLEGDNITDVVVVRAEAGDKVIIPPNYGHITINESNKTLKMANWVGADFSSEYERYRQAEGGAYFLTEDGFIPNPHHKELPKIRYIKPTNFPDEGLYKGREMYGLVRDIGKLKYLTHPQEYTGLFDKCISVGREV